MDRQRPVEISINSTQFVALNCGVVLIRYRELLNQLVAQTQKHAIHMKDRRSSNYLKSILCDLLDFRTRQQ